jgi:hypothetical protein
LKKWNGTTTMNKTKVRVSPALLDYWQMMEWRVDQLRDRKLQIAARVKENLEPYDEPCDYLASDQVGLLLPPCIEYMLPMFYLTDGGAVEGIIQFITSDLFGIAHISLTVKDATGRLLESGHAWREESSLGHWVYLPEVAPPLGSTVVVRAVIADALGGASIVEESCTVGQSNLEWDHPGEMA